MHFVMDGWNNVFSNCSYERLALWVPCRFWNGKWPRRLPRIGDSMSFTGFLVVTWQVYQRERVSDKWGSSKRIVLYMEKKSWTSLPFRSLQSTFTSCEKGSFRISWEIHVKTFLEFSVEMLLVWGDNDERTDNMRYSFNPMRTSHGQFRRFVRKKRSHKFLEVKWPNRK